MPRVLVVDDEFDLCEILRFNLESEGFDVDTAQSAEEALSLIDGGLRPDLILLDVMMEKMSGFDMAKVLRQRGDEVPIIFLTALNTEQELLLGFESGADDYVTKPYSFQTVLARIRAVLKRSASQPPAVTSNTICIDNLHINLDDKTVRVNDTEIILTRKEYSILLLLVQHPGTYFSREQIISQVWEPDIYVCDRSVDVHIARIRKKLLEVGERISNRTGMGYYFA